MTLIVLDLASGSYVTLKWFLRAAIGAISPWRFNANRWDGHSSQKAVGQAIGADCPFRNLPQRSLPNRKTQVQRYAILARTGHLRYESAPGSKPSPTTGCSADEGQTSIASWETQFLLC